MLRLASSLALISATAFIVGCGSAVTATTTTSSGTSTSPGTGSSSSSNSGLDMTKLPVGDYQYSSTTPAVGSIYSCQTSFNGKGATGSTPWINTTAGTYDFTAKPAVQGSVAWPTHAYTITLSGSNRVVTTNDLPNHNTGTFPIAKSDPASQYDSNPNSILTQAVVYTMLANPTAAASPTCVGGGAVGILLTGSLLFNGLDAEGRDAVAHEIQDSCQGHPQEAGQYHYHNVTSCISDSGSGHSNLLGYALDGFGIYGVRGEDGKVLTNADLDACHGHTHAITWDGQTVTMYHYHATYAYPYTIGCYKGTPAKISSQYGILLKPHEHHHAGPPHGGSAHQHDTIS